jgi:FkbM family methyltransferase
MVSTAQAACILRFKSQPMISYAQNFEDVMLWRVFRNITNGHYVDVGAFHPEIDSVTKWFYEQGWSGINIEPVPESFAVLRESRPRDRNICAAAGASIGTSEMTVVCDSLGLSSLRPPDRYLSANHTVINVDVLPLEDMLESLEGVPIHFLKIDTEGEEREVLLGMNFHRFRPWVLVVEATEPQNSRVVSEQWCDILVENRYERVYFDGLNEFFLAEEHRNLIEHFQAPPNVFDDFELAATVRERRWRNEMEGSLRAEIQALRKELALSRTQLSSCQAQGDKLRSDLAELAQQLNISREMLDSIFKSRSWRWLGPIRRLNAGIRSYRDRFQSR